MESPNRSPTPMEEEDDLPLCVICQSAITEKAVLRPCGHSYDFECIRTWLEIRPLCPLCKGSPGLLDQYDHEGVVVVCRYSVTPRVPPPSCRRPSVIRCHIYHRNLRTTYIGVIPLSDYPPITPSTFNADAALQARARTFIARELSAVFPYLTQSPNSPGPEFMLMYAISLLKFVDINEDGGRIAEGLLRGYLGGRAAPARVFLHEVGAFLRSGCQTLEEFDRLARYAPAPNYEGVEVSAGAAPAPAPALAPAPAAAATTAATASESRGDERRVERGDGSERPPPQWRGK